MRTKRAAGLLCLLLSGLGIAGCTSPQVVAGVPGVKARATVAALDSFKLGPCPSAPEGGAGTASRTGDPRARAAAQRGLDFLKKEASAWQRQNGCYGCHVQAVTLEALTVGRKNHYDVGSADLQPIIEGMTTLPGGARGPIGFSVRDSPGYLVETSRAFGGAALAHYDEIISGDLQKDLLRTAEQLLTAQEADGSVRESYVSLPVAAGRAQASMQAAQTWRQAYARTADDRWLAPLARVEKYLSERAAQLSDEPAPATQDLNYTLLGLLNAGATLAEAKVTRLSDKLLSRQAQDGGFGYAAGEAPNAFATGQSLFVLRRLGFDDGHPAILKGTAWLLSHQAEDGGWSHGGFGKAEAMWGVLGLVSLDVMSITTAGVTDGEHIDGTRAITARAKDNKGRGIAKMEVLVDDVRVFGACGGELTYALPADRLGDGKHVIQVIAHNAAGQRAVRRMEVHAGASYLTQVASKYEDGGTLLSLRNLASAEAKSELAVKVFAVPDGGLPTDKGALVWSSRQSAGQGAVSVFWNGRDTTGEPAKRGKYVAELTLMGTGGKVMHAVDWPFFHDTPEVAQATMGEVEGQLSLGAADVAENTRVELVDGKGRVVQSTVSTRSGSYRFKNVDAGKYKVRVQKKGFKAAESEVNAAPAAAPAKVDLQL